MRRIVVLFIVLTCGYTMASSETKLPDAVWTMPLFMSNFVFGKNITLDLVYRKVPFQTVDQLDGSKAYSKLDGPYTVTGNSIYFTVATFRGSKKLMKITIAYTPHFDTGVVYADSYIINNLETGQVTKANAASEYDGTEQGTARGQGKIIATLQVLVPLWFGDTIFQQKLTEYWATGTVSFDPKPGNYFKPVDLVLTSSSTQDRVFYTTDGSNLTATSKPYTSPIHLEPRDSRWTIRAVTINTNNILGTPIVGDFTVSAPTPPNSGNPVSTTTVNSEAESQVK